MPAYELVIEGENPQPFLRQMEKSGSVRVLGPHIDRHSYPSGIEGMRMAVKVSASSVAEARSLVEGYLPDDQGFVVKPVMRRA